MGVHLIAVAVALGNVVRAIDLGDLAARLQFGVEGAKAHGAAEVAALLADFKFIALHPLGHGAHDGLLGLAELGGARILDPAQRACRLDASHLHAEADAEIGHLAGAGEGRRLDLAFRTTLTEAARNEDAVHALEIGGRVLLLEDFRLDPVEVDLHLVGDAAMDERLLQRLVGIEQTGVLSHHGDVHLALRLGDAAHDFGPLRQVRFPGVLETEDLQHFPVEAFVVIGARHVVDRLDVQRLDHGGRTHVAEQRDLAALVQRNFAVSTAQQDVGLDAD